MIGNFLLVISIGIVVFSYLLIFIKYIVKLSNLDVNESQKILYILSKFLVFIWLFFLYVKIRCVFRKNAI